MFRAVRLSSAFRASSRSSALVAQCRPRSVVSQQRGFATRLYSKDHEWAEVLSKDTVKLGITDFAQEKLGELVFVDLPEPNTQIKKGATFATVESVKAASDVYSPFTGTVIESNSNLKDQPDLVNKSPFTDGWFVTLKTSDFGAESKELMDENAYKEFCENESH